MTDDNDTIPVSAVGIGDDEVQAELERIEDEIHEEYGHAIHETDVDTTILAGAAQIKVVSEYDKVPRSVQSWLMQEQQLVMVHAELNDQDRMVAKFVPLEIYHVIVGYGINEQLRALRDELESEATKHREAKDTGPGGDYAPVAYEQAAVRVDEILNGGDSQ